MLTMDNEQPRENSEMEIFRFDLWQSAKNITVRAAGSDWRLCVVLGKEF